MALALLFLMLAAAILYGEGGTPQAFNAVMFWGFVLTLAQGAFTSRELDWLIKRQGDTADKELSSIGELVSSLRTLAQQNQVTRAQMNTIARDVEWLRIAIEQAEERADGNRGSPWGGR